MNKRSVGISAVERMKRVALAAGMALAVLCALPSVASAETRTLKLYNTHTKERVSITFKKNGRYIPSGLREANRFLRDWRRNEIIKMDPELLDLVWEVYKKVGARDHIYVVSSYRSPATNNMLRKRSKGVARNSQHTLGKAMDFYIPGVNLAKLRAAGLRKHVGGVGYYPRSGSPFVHMDTGSVRHWPKMSRSQLARVFPNGKTLHIPSDGRRMKNYNLALAEVKSGKNRRSSPTLVASSNSVEPRSPNTRNQSVTSAPRPTPPANIERENQGGNLLASLFGGGDRSGQTDTARPGAVSTSRTAAVQNTASAVIENPPVPGRKIPQTAPVQPDAPIALAAAPTIKPADSTAQVQLASAPPPPPNTLDAQRAALRAGQPTAASRPLDARFQVAEAPAQKPNPTLAAATQQAAQRLGGPAPIPAAAPATDPVAAIAAATGTALPSPVPAPRPETTLAYASATATPPDANRLLTGATASQARAPAPQPTTTGARSTPRPTVSGRIPKDQIVDPLAGFASLPNKSKTAFLSGMATTKSKAFASLSHPNQRQLENVIMPGNRFMAAGFGARPYGTMSSDRFDGPAIVVLPVRFAR